MYVPGRQIGGAALTGLAQPTMQQLWGNLVGTMQRTTATPPYARPTSALAFNPQIQIHAYICICMCIHTTNTCSLTKTIMNFQNPMVENIIIDYMYFLLHGKLEQAMLKPKEKNVSCTHGQEI